MDMSERGLPESRIPELIENDYKAAVQQARVPPAEVIWMQAQLRAREEAARKAVRPIVLGQAIGIAALAGLLIALVSRFSLSQLPQIPWPLVEVVVGSWLVLAPLALYFAFSRD